MVKVRLMKSINFPLGTNFETISKLSCLPLLNYISDAISYRWGHILTVLSDQNVKFISTLNKL
jgi:hypothetical protein